MAGVAFAAALPADLQDGRFLGRLALPDGPTPVLVAGGIAYDMTPVAPTVADLVAMRGFDEAAGRAIGPLADHGDALLSPIDLQCVKAAGVTFAVSTLERVIEERARGDATAAIALRGRIEERVGASLRDVAPGSPAAQELKRGLIAEGVWSPYLEVAIGPDAEIFTKAPVLATVGHGAKIGVRSDSAWNNPEPEVVLLVAPDGEIVGATLGNDVNLRDIEGRSSLLVGKAKDNNASAALGPLVRLFDTGFGMADVRAMTVSLTIEGADGFRLDGHSDMGQISRDPAELVRQTMNQHDYPDGFCLYLGTLFAPTDDRGTLGHGFTHKTGDVVSIAAPRLGTLVNTVVPCSEAPPWRDGIAALMRNLAARGLLA